MPASAREFFEALASRRASPRTRGLSASYRFDVDGEGSWRVVIDDGALSVEESDAAADCVIRASEETFLRIVHGEENAMGAFLTGKVKVSGEVGLALRLRDLLA
jgi:putative sterol carrier protein